MNGLNHLTLAVRHVQRSFSFYVDVLGATPVVRWDSGAYLTIGELWLCLSQDDGFDALDAGYTHYAFSVTPEQFVPLKRRLLAAGARPWKVNRSEGESFYFLDPDGHQLEIHVGDLTSRLQALREKPYPGLQWFNQQ